MHVLPVWVLFRINLFLLTAAGVWDIFNLHSKPMMFCHFSSSFVDCASWSTSAVCRGYAVQCLWSLVTANKEGKMLLCSMNATEAELMLFLNRIALKTKLKS